jgi:hypothetical protein
LKRRNVIILLVSTLLLTVGVLVYLTLAKEPRYQGRTLSQWLEPATRDSRYLYILAGQPADPDFLTTRDAIQAMGTNAIPFFIKWSFAHDSKTRAAIISWLNLRLPQRFQLWSAEGRCVASDIGFGLLADKSRPAWPLFVQWTYDQDSGRRFLGMRSLLETKADKDIIVPVFRRLLDDPSLSLRQSAASGFSLYYRKEAADAGVYKKFPELHLQLTPGSELPPVY